MFDYSSVTKVNLHGRRYFMDRSPLGKRLKEARMAKGISQKKLGVLAMIDEFTASARMNQYENSKHAPDYLSLKRIAGVLELPPAYFYAEEDDLAEVIKLYCSLSKQKTHYILNKLRKLSQNNNSDKILIEV